MDEARARQLLQAERSEITGLLKQTNADTAEDRPPDGPRDSIDVAQPIEAEIEEDAVADDLRERIAAIDRALGRLDEGTYGRSVRSGKPIPDERLEADPAAELTIEEARAQR
jgi:RNA polymerase-binding transcription factor